MVRNYKNIKAWQLADQLVKKVYINTKDFPKEELYGLVSQLRRSAVSVPTNIVEGSSRKQKKDYLRFLHIAKASLSEVEYLLNLSVDLGYLNKETGLMLDSLCQETASTLYGLICAVQKEI